MEMRGRRTGYIAVCLFFSIMAWDAIYTFTVMEMDCIHINM